MKLTHHSDRHWERVIKSLALAIAVGGLALLVPGGGPAQAASPTLEAIPGLPQDWDKTWSATTVADSSDSARVVSFQNGGVTGQNKTVSSNLAWCVRGPMQESVY